MGNKKGIKMIVAIVERSHGKALAKFLTTRGISFHYQCPAVGTAPSDLLDIIGIGSSERDVLFCFAATDVADRFMYQLKNDELDGSVDAKGIVFDMPLTGLNNIITTVLLKKESEAFEDGGYRMEQKGSNSMILLVVNQGHTDAVMDTARKAGARGGTVIKARFSGEEGAEQLNGFMLQQEKEMILIVASGERRKQIMEAVNEKHGLSTEAAAMICSLGIDQIAKLG